MALKIGGISFDVDAQTQGLQKAVDQLKQFQRVVDQTAKSQTKGAQAAAAALGRQESAIKRAFQQALNLRRALLAAEAPPTELARVTTAFQRLTRELTSGQVSSIEFSRAMDAFNARINRSSRALKDLKAAEASKQVSKFTEVMRDLESAAVLSLGPLSGLGARIRSLSAIANRSTLSLAAMLGAVIGVSTAFLGLSANALRAGAELQKINSRFEAATGTQEAARKEMHFIVRTSNELGLRIEDAANSYSKLTAASMGTALQGQKTRDVFLAVATAGSAMSLNNEEMQGIFLALEQMMSKGTVQAEELRGQLGERLPAAYRLSAKAAGVMASKLNDLLRKGGIQAEDFLPKLAKVLIDTFGAAAQKNLNTYQKAVNRLHNAWTLFGDAFDQAFGITDKVIRAIKALTGVIDFLREHLKGVAEFAGAITGALIAMAAPAIIQGFVLLAGVIANAAKAMALFDAAVLENPLGAIGKVATVVAGAAAGMAVVDALLGDIDDLTKALGDDLNGLGNNNGLPNLTDKFNAAWQKVQDVSDETSTMIQTMKGLGSTNDIMLVKGLEQARQLIKKLNADELTQLNKNISDFYKGSSIAGLPLLDQLQAIFAASERTKKSYSDWLNRLEQTPERIREIDQEFLLVADHIRALQKGPRALEVFDRVDDHAKAMERMRDQLEKTVKSEEYRQAKLEAYEKLLYRLEYAEEHFSTASADMAKAFTDSLEDAIVNGEKLTDVMRNLEKELVSIALRAAVFDPLEKAISAGLGGFFGKNTTDPYAGVASAHGNAFVGGRLKKFAKGGILGGPTFFGMKGGVGLAGEAGTEAVMPLRRTSSGDLGVVASGGGVIVNVYDMRRSKGAEPVEVQQSEGPDGMKMLTVLIRDTVKDMHNKGEMDKTLGRNYGLSRRGTR